MAVTARFAKIDQPGALAGLIFIGIGVLGLIASRSLAFGSLSMMGSGFLPRILAVAVVGVGMLTLARALLSAQAVGISPTNLRAILCILVAVAGFAVINIYAGYLAAATFLIVVSALARPARRWHETLLLVVVMCVATTLIFIVGLGVQLRLF
ncbi:MAG: tripartite tricarboxylate transporter TctB family protein [Shinella sp.]|uniref:tripartite tricarboxylate transporter TctB family protein n=1 Tax=Shinella sp. TaxID=1870904 RepID=UPI0040367CA4